MHAAYTVRAVKEQRRRVVGDKLVDKLLADYKRRTGTRASPSLRARIQAAMRDLLHRSGGAVKSSDVVQAFKAVVATEADDTNPAARPSAVGAAIGAARRKNSAPDASGARASLPHNAAAGAGRLPPPVPAPDAALGPPRDDGSSLPPPPSRQRGPASASLANRRGKLAAAGLRRGPDVRGEAVCPFQFDHCPTYTPEVMLDPDGDRPAPRGDVGGSQMLQSLQRSTPSRLMGLLSPEPTQGKLRVAEGKSQIAQSNLSCERPPLVVGGVRRPATSHPAHKAAAGSSGASIFSTSDGRSAQVSMSGDNAVRRNLQASPDTPFPPVGGGGVGGLLPRPPSGSVTGAGGGAPAEGMIATLASHGGHLWPVPQDNPKCRDLRREKEGEWAQRVKADMESFKQEVSERRQIQRDLKLEHKRTLAEQMEEQKSRARQQQEADLQYDRQQDEVKRQLDAREDAMRAQRRQNKHTARQQMLEEIHTREEHKASSNEARRREEASIRETLQRDADRIQQEKIHQIRKNRRMAEEAHHFNEWSKGERVKHEHMVVAADNRINRATRAAHYTPGTGVATRASSRPPTSGRAAVPTPQQQQQQQQRNGATCVAAIFQQQQAAQEKKRQELDMRAEQEAEQQLKRIELEIEAERKRRENMTAQMRQEYRAKQAEREQKLTQEREEKRRARNVLEEAHAKYAQEEQEMRHKDAERKMQYIKALKEQVEASPRPTEQEPEVCITKRYNFRY